MGEPTLLRAPHSEVTATLEALACQGVMPCHLANLRRNEQFARQVAEIIIRNGVKAPVREDYFRNFLGKNCFLPFHWTEIFNLRFTQNQLAQAYKALPVRLRQLSEQSPFKGDSGSISSYCFLFYWPGKVSYADYNTEFLEWSYRESGINEDDRFINRLNGSEPTIGRGWYMLRIDGVPGTGPSTVTCSDYEYKVKLLPNGWKTSQLEEERIKFVLMQLQGVRLPDLKGDTSHQLDQFNLLCLDEKGSTGPREPGRLASIRPQSRSTNGIWKTEVKAAHQDQVHEYLGATGLRITF